MRPGAEAARSAPDEGGWQPVAPSAARLRRRLARAARARRGARSRASSRPSQPPRVAPLAAGFRVVEVHAAHGYLLHEFLSPLSNQRSDRYGGDFEGRMRLPLEVVAAVRDALARRVAALVRISATDWVDGGWSLDDSVALAQRLRPLGVDLVDCSSGGNSPAQQIPLGPGYQVPFAAAIRARGRHRHRRGRTDHGAARRPRRSCRGRRRRDPARPRARCATHPGPCVPLSSWVWRATTGPRSTCVRGRA